MINALQFSTIYVENFEMPLSEKELIADKILIAIKENQCNIFDFSDGETLIPVKFIASLDYEIPLDMYSKNKYLQDNRGCFELLNKCDGSGYKLENVTKMCRYLFDFDFDNSVDLNDTIQTIKDILIFYNLYCRCVFTGGRGVHIVVLSNDAKSIKKYQNIWYELYKIFQAIIPIKILFYLDTVTDLPNKYTRLPNAIRNNGNMQFLIYENLQFWEVTTLQEEEKTYTWKDTMQYKNGNESIQNSKFNNSTFNLDTFYRHTKNNNVRLFLDCSASEGSRTTTAVSAIGTLKTAGCSPDIIIELTEKYCDKTGAKLQHFSNILKF